MTHVRPANVIAACLLGALCGTASGADRPNILLIMADDLGAENLGCYGNSVYSTPNLDRMAREGAAFDNAFATPVCTPTRAMILTSLHPNRSGFLERLDSPLDRIEKRNRLPTHLKTFGHVFQDAGYTTAIAGKWHLGDFQTYPDQPASHGFSEYSLWVQYWDGSRQSRYYSPHIWENGKLRVFGKDIFGPDYYADFLIDGMDLSHNLLGRPGTDREYFFMAFEGGCFFVRDKRFRLHEDGRFYDVPVSNLETRYSMKQVANKPRYAAQIEDLQRRLNKYMAIRKTDTTYDVLPFGTNGDLFKNKQHATQTRRAR